MTSRDTTIGFLGLDGIGAAIADRLVAQGSRLSVWDLAAERRRTTTTRADPRMSLAPGLSDLGRTCDLVISTLAIGALRTAALGDSDRTGFALEMAPGSLILDMGLAHPAEARQLAVWLGRAGIGLVDAPAMGDAAAAAAGKLDIAVGGYVEFVDRLMPLLRLLGSVHRAHGPGSGHALAAAMAYARFAKAAAARQALMVGESLGLSADLMPDVAAAALDGGDSDPRLAIARQLAEELAQGEVTPGAPVQPSRHAVGS